MRSLAVKLTLAFLVVGIAGAVLVSLISIQRTRLEFGRFVSEGRDNSAVADLLYGYYLESGGWEGLGEWLRSDPSLGFFGRRILLADSQDNVVYSALPEHYGRNADDLETLAGTPILHNDRLIGTLYLRARSSLEGAPPRFSPESFFLRSVSQATGLAALIAALLALALGVLLARALTRPLKELTAASGAVAAGNLGKQVEVESKDEIGELAASFNMMSKDLARASSLRRQMTADIAHDLGTPLTVLRGYTDGLRDGTIEGGQELYAALNEEVAHLQHLVEDLRTLSLADAGELTLRLRAVDPRALLERVGLAHVVAARQKGVDLRIDAAETLPSVQVDVERMTQVLNNLVSNALRFTAQGQIVLSASAGSGAITLHVTDSGTGIPPEDLNSIFDRFFKVDRSRHRESQSQSGLGLAIARAIVELHRGTIRAESTLGQGTRFSIELPRS